MSTNGELKVVISLRGEKASVGVQAPECDPIFFNINGDLKVTLKAVPGFVQEAKTRWETSKLNPKCESELPSQAEAKARASTPTRIATTSRTQKSGAQPPMF
jgi:hypothetical protein